MLDTEEWMKIRSLRSEGHSVKAIARMTGLSRNTVRRVLREKAPQPYRRAERLCQLDPFKDYLRDRFGETCLSAMRLIDEIRPMGYAGSLQTLRRFLGPLRKEAGRNGKLTVRFETPPGKQGQSDWGYCGRFTDASGNVIPIYAMVTVLGFSRVMYVQFTTSMTVAELIRCHMNALEYFGGWPHELLFDNMKQVRLSQTEWNPLFLDFATHYGISLSTHRVRRPRTKGKVERMVAYVKDNFLNGRSFADLSELNAQAQHWLNHTANTRLHATTGRRPIDLLQAEGVTPARSVVPYRIAESNVRTANWTGLVRFSRSQYSVPPEYAGRPVVVCLRDDKVIIRSGDMIVAEHQPATKPGMLVATPEHVANMWKLSLETGGAPLPHWSLTFDESIHTRALSTYEEVPA